jgi:hypothetical protein
MLVHAGLRRATQSGGKIETEPPPPTPPQNKFGEGREILHPSLSLCSDRGHS